MLIYVTAKFRSSGPIKGIKLNMHMLRKSDDVLEVTLRDKMSF